MKTEKKERNKERDPNPATLDHSVVSYDPQGSHGEPIVSDTPQPPTEPQGMKRRKTWNSSFFKLTHTHTHTYTHTHMHTRTYTHAHTQDLHQTEKFNVILIG